MSNRVSYARGVRRRGCAWALLLAAFAPGLAAQTISNTATVTYQVGATSAAITQDSNTVVVTASGPPSPAVVRFFQYASNAPGAQPLVADGGGYGGALSDAGGASYTPLPAPTTLYGGAIDLSRPVPVRETSVYHAGEPVFIALTDASRNTNPALREFINLTLTNPDTGDMETLRLQETGPDTGIFATVIQSVGAAAGVAANDGRITVDVNTPLQVDYADPTDPADLAQSRALVDPFGIVFDALNGAPVAGATVTLINTDTGAPAAVFCDDGYSACPSTLVTPAAPMPVAGLGVLPPGGFRFPFVQPGNYRLAVTPPATYTTPSGICSIGSCPVTDAGGQPYSVTQGSFGEAFVIVPGPALNIDIPADPVSTTLLLQKAASATQISAGDTVQYRLALQNRDTVDATNVVITDTLPAGFRYESGSLRVGGAAAGDPAVGADGRTLSIGVDTVLAGTRVEIRYLARSVGRSATREAVNVAVATADGGVASNAARAAVRVREAFFGSGFTLIGRVLESCAAPVPACPIEAAAPAAAPTRTYSLRAQFDSGRASLKPAGVRDLERLVAELEGKDIERLELIGHTDSQRVGNPETVRRFGDNYGLSRARAAAVGDYLAGALGLQPAQIGATGKGPDEPIAPNDSPANMAKNRRTEVRVFERGAAPAAACAVPAAAQDGAPRGVPSARLVLDDGTYVATDRDGLYHFEGLRAGSHVVQLDLDSLAPGLQVVPRIQNTRVAGRGTSQFVDAHGGSLWRADFHVCSAGEPVSLALSTRRGPPDAAGGGVREFTLRAQFDSGRDTLKDQGRRDLDALVAKLRVLDIERIETEGHTDSQPLGARTAARFGDNYGLSLARARAVGGYLARGLGLAPDQVRASGVGPDQPLAANDTPANLARNRRTEVRVYQREGNRATVRADALLHQVELAGGGVPVRKLRVTVMLPEGAAIVPGSARLDGAVWPDPEIAGGAATFRVGDVGAHWRRALVFETRLAPTAACEASAGEVRAVATFDTARRSSVSTPPAVNAVPCAPVAEPVFSGHQRVVVQGAVERSAPESIEARTRKRRTIVDDAEAAGGRTDWLAGATPGIEWLFPPADANARAPATRIVIKHAPGQAVVLEYIEGEAVNALNFDGTRTNDARTVAVSSWRGVPLSDGDNRFRALVLGPGGEVLRRLERVVRFSNAPARAELVPEESVLVADGIRPPVIAVRVIDREGRAVRAGVTGGFRLNPPFLPRETLEQQQQRQLAGLDRFSPTWKIEGDDGVAYIELQPTTASGEAVLGFEFLGATAQQPARRQELRTWITAAPREWLLVGFAAGTAGYHTLKGNVASLPPGTEDRFHTDGQASVYAKGRVRGEWLLTLAYDSDKPEERERRRSLLSTIDPDEYYTLYGDGAEQRYDAPSQDKLYLKLERRQFYALFGDYDTGLTVTRLSRYSRTVNGLKTELGGGPLVWNAFAAETPQDFARDELRGDGTSGLYRLSRRGIVLNSEKVRIETRDRFRSERIVATRFLVRHLDYDIDYANGTLFFREPVFSRDEHFNPVYIVAEYETFGAGEAELNAGGRVGLKLLDGRLDAGVSAIREERFAGEGDLAGADLKLRVGTDTELRVEGAQSDGRQGTIARDGAAYLAEVEHHGDKLDALVYSRRQDPGFGLNQQNGSEAGADKLGADLGYHLTPKLALQGQAWRQENLGSEATRDLGSARLQYRGEAGTMSAGYQVARDRVLTGEEFESQQAVLGASRWFLDRTLELSGNADLSMGDNANLDFPARYQAGVGYNLTPDTRLILAQEYTDGEAYDTTTTRAGLQAVPWKGARLSTTLGQGGITEYGPRTYAQMGLTQSLLIGRGWGIDLGFDASRTLEESGQPAFVFNPNQAAASGGANPTEDFVALTGGLTYRSELWSWNGRAEARDSASSDRYGLTTGFLRQARAGVAFSAQAQAFATELATGAEGRYGNASLSWAWRPLASRWSVLDRLEYRHDELSGGSGLPGSELFGQTTLNVAGDARTRRLVNNFNLNRVSRAWTTEDGRGNVFRLEQRNQWSVYYGAKYSFDRYDGVDYSGYTDLLGLELRYDLRRWLDFGVQASGLHAWKAETWDYSFGPQLGFTPFTNGWISVGYNLIGFHDRDFDAARYTAQGPYLRLRFKFDQDTRPLGPDREDPRVMAWDEHAVAPGAGSRP